METVSVIKIDTQSANKSVKDLRKELKELKDTLVSVEAGSEEYTEALRRAADIQHQLTDTQREIRQSAADFGQIFSNTTSVLGGLTAGFQAAQASMNLFGVESEDIVKSLQRMQNLMALTQAIPAIDKAVKGFRGLATVISTAAGATSAFGKALISTGIGAIVTALGLLIANWDKLSEAIGLNTDKLRENAEQKTTEKLSRQNDELQRQINLYRQLAEIQGKSKSEIEAGTLELMVKSQDELLQQQNELINRRDELNKLINDTYGIYLQSGVDATAASIMAKNATREYRNELAQVEGELKSVNTQLGINQTSLEKQQDTVNDTKTIETAKNQVEANKSISEQLGIQKKLIGEIEELGGDSNWANSLYDGTKKSTEELERYKTILLEIKDSIYEISSNKPLEALEPPQLIEEDEEKEDDFSKTAKYYEQIRQTVDNLREAFAETEDIYAMEQEALDTALRAKIISQEEYNTLSEKLAKEHADKQKMLAVQETQLWIQSLANISSVFSSIADTIDRSTEEGEKKYKAMMYTSTLLSMLSGVGGAIASAFMPTNAYLTIFGQIAMAATASASVIASGIAQLSQIKNAGSNSSLGGGGSSFSPATQAVSAISAPVQYTQDVQGASIEGAIKDTRVYVTEGDITSTQRRVSVTEEEARF